MAWVSSGQCGLYSSRESLSKLRVGLLVLSLALDAAGRISVLLTGVTCFSVTAEVCT